MTVTVYDLLDALRDRSGSGVISLVIHMLESEKQATEARLRDLDLAVGRAASENAALKADIARLCDEVERGAIAPDALRTHGARVLAEHLARRLASVKAKGMEPGPTSS